MPAKTKFLRIRLEPGDKRKVAAAAKTEYLEDSTWARQVLLKAADAVLDDNDNMLSLGHAKSK